MLDAALALSTAEPALDDQTRFIPQPSWTLSETAEHILRNTFAEHGHSPAEAHWDALREIPTTMQAMADGTAEPNVFLASLCPGLGKSSAVVATAVALTTMEAYRDVGILVAVGRLAEAQSLIKAMQKAGIGPLVAAKTSDDATNMLSGCAPEDAPVLIVTQQALELQTRRRPFAEVAALHYRGKVRACRVWDELWEPGRVLTLERDDLQGLLAPARKISFPFRNAIEALTDRLRSAEHDTLLPIDDWEEKFGVSEADLLGALHGLEGEHQNTRQATASGLFAMSGRTIRVHRENYAEGGQGRVFVSYEETHPADFAPLLVLDASIRVKQTYQDAIAFRGLNLLRSATKDYSPLTVHLWTTSASKTGWRENGDTLLDGIVSTILTKPAERWLIVGHKQLRRGVDVPKQMMKALPPSMRGRVSFIGWGRHAATNEFRDYENVILASNFFLPSLTYLAKTHMARGHLPELHGFADSEDVRETTWGEHRHNIVQAACRGRCRQSDGERCASMSLYIIAAASSGIPRPETIQRMFPGARTVRWCPLPPKLRGRAVDAAAVLERLMEEESRLTELGDFLSYGKLLELLKAVDSKAASLRCDHFIQRVTERDDWQNHIVALGLVEETHPNPRGGRDLRGLRVAEVGNVTERFVEHD